MNEETGPETGISVESEPTKKPDYNPGIWRVLAVVLLIINALVVYVKSDPGSAMTHYEQGAVAGHVTFVLLLPAIVVGIFSMGKRFRNAKSRWKIVFWSSILIFVAQFAQ